MKKLPVLLIIFLLFIFATQGPLTPSTTVDDDNIGTEVWVTPNNAQTENGSVTASFLSDGEESHYLKCTNFGFSIPSGTIDGITVTWKASASGASSIQNSTQTICKGGVISGDPALMNTETITTSLEFYTAGSGTDLWNNTWTPADINSSTFGVGISVSCFGGVEAGNIDVVKITVTYTEVATKKRIISQMREVTFVN
jgi:hypothetical protein